MNDPHVVALNYSILHDGTVKYDDAPPLEYDGPEFSVRVADEKVRLELKTHTTQRKTLHYRRSTATSAVGSWAPLWPCP